jgi:hypothetical protein
VDLGEHRLLVGDVHAHVHHQGDVEARVLERQRLTRSGHERGPLRESDPRGELAGGGHEVLGQVDPGDLSSPLRGQPGRATDPAPDIQQPLSGRDTERVEHVAGARCTACVQLVDRVEVLGSEPREVGAGPGQRRQDRLAQVTCAVVPPDQLAYVHRRASRSAR